MTTEDMGKHTIKDKLTLSLGALMGILALLKFLVSLILVLVATGNINSYAESSVSEQIILRSGGLLNQTSNLLVTYLNISTNGLIQPIVYSITNIYRPGFIFINDITTNYFDWNTTTLSQPLEYSTRQQRMVSLINSDYYLPNTSYSDLSGFSAQINQTIGETNYLDEVWISLYSRYEDFVSVYIGLTSIGLFRQYPGTPTSQLNPSYDPRLRPWYEQATSNQDQTIITPPYIDAHGLGKMVTFSQTFEDPSGNLRGVVGGDLLIQTLVDTIQKIDLYQTGNMILIQTDKTIIVNKDNDTSFLNLINLTVAFGQPQTANNGTYVYVYQRIKEYGGNYILIAKVNSSEIEAPLQTVKDNMQSTKLALILILLAIFLGILVLAVILIIPVVRGVVRPLEEVRHVIHDIIHKKAETDRKDTQKKQSKAAKGRVANIAEVVAMLKRLEEMKYEFKKNKQISFNQMRMENTFYGKNREDIPWEFRANDYSSPNRFMRRNSEIDSGLIEIRS